jgi:hypothetical protein
MPSTYSNLKIQLMATGENTTTWGDVTNVNIGTALEEAIVGSADVTFASANVTLSLADTNSSQTARNMRLRCTGTTGGSTRNLVVPSIEKPYIVQNDCADSIIVKTAAGSGITVPAGKTTWVVSNGTDVVDVVTHVSSLTIGTALPAASGGTGNNTYTTGDILYASGATTLTRLADVATGNALISGGVGVAPSYGKIGLTTHITGTLAVSNGGTGATTLTGYVKGSGTSALTASATVPASDISSGAALTRTNDTNVTLTLGGSPTTALLAASSLTLGWTGTLAISRGGTGSSSTTYCSLTTNVTGTLPVANGGTGQSSYTDGQLLIGNTTGNTLAKATLTAGTGITVTNGSGSITIANSLPLSDFTSAISTTAPNDTVSAASLTVTGAATNIDAVFAPKGTGAILAEVPDSATAGGDKRGSNATDWQRTRTVSTMVASGSAATLGGGTNNTASGAGSTVAGGQTNVASNTNATVAGGTGGTASATFATISGGQSNTASGSGSTVAGGQVNVASSTSATVTGGRNNTADGTYSTVGGYYATARGVDGANVQASGSFSTTAGTAQHGTYVVRRETTDATTSTLTTNGTSVSAASEIVTLPDTATYAFDILVTARRTDAADESAGYRLVGVIDRQSGAATTALVGTVTKTVIAEDTAAWDVDVIVDTTYGGFSVNVTGEVGKTIRWVAVINTVEVVNG